MNKLAIPLLLAVAAVMLEARPAAAQAAQAAPAACHDEESMAEDSAKTITDFVVEVKKESLQDFESKFHQKAGISKLNFALELVDQAASCFDKASQDSSATQEQQDSYKAKKVEYASQKRTLTQARSALKAAEDSKQAKGIIEKLALK
jgi:hypothetical protein